MTETNHDKNKSIGRNIFSENKVSFSDTNEEVQEKNFQSKEIEVNKEEEKVYSSPEKELDIIESHDSSVKKRKFGVKKDKTDIITALHVDHNAVSLVQTEFDGESYTCINAAVEPLQSDIVDIDNLNKSSRDLILTQTSGINEVFEKTGINKKNVRVVSSMNGNNIIIKQITVKDKDLADIEAELPTILPAPFDDPLCRYEYVLLKSREIDGIQEHELLVSIVGSKIFFNTQNLINSAGIDCKILDLDIMAVTNLYLATIQPEKNEINCIVDIGREYSHIIIVAGKNEEIYVRNLDFTYDAFQKILAKNRGIALVEAEEMIKSKNFHEYLSKAFENETTENLNKHYSVKEFIRGSLLTELQRTFKFYTRQDFSRLPKKIFLSGMASEIKKIVPFIVNSMDIYCEMLDVCDFMEGNSNLKSYIKENASVVYKAIGLSLRYE